MEKTKPWAIVFAAIGLILSHAMCAHVAFAYCDGLWGIACRGYSAPASVAFFLLIPYLSGMIVSFVLAWIFGKKAK